ncbi:MAG: HAMP domain-containing sensor histidine kinase [Pseudomonadota bacterium]
MRRSAVPDTGSVTALSKLYRTTAFKLTLVYLIVFAVLTFGLIAYFVYNTGELLSRQYALSTSEELDAFARVYQRGGIRRTVQLVDRRARAPGSGIYLITDPSGRYLAGNISEIGVEAFNNDRLRPVPYRGFSLSANDDDGITDWRPSLVRAVVLPGGFNLIVGRDIREGEQFRQIVRRAGVLSIAIFLVLASTSVFFISRRVIRRMEVVSDTSQTIIDGDLTQRIPLMGTDDEFDRLAVNLNRMLDRIEALMTGLKEVSDNVAHDLKTPLTRTRTRLEATLRDAEADGSALREALSETLADCDDLIATFNALLSIARAEAGEAGGFEPFDAVTLVQDLAELYEPLVEEAGASLTIETPDTATVNGQRQLLGQAITNLLDNALKYGLSADQPAITLRVKNADEAVHISVADNGSGIPEADRERVTARFTRLDKSRSKPGSGLGLSLVKAVATLHKGQLSLGDGVDRSGLEVTLTIPRDEAAR